MLDIKRIKDDPEKVKAGLRAKEVDCDQEVDRILELDKVRRDTIFATEQMKAEQNKVSKTIPQLKKAGEDTAPVFQRMGELKAQIAANDEKLRSIEGEYRTLMLSLPNLPDDDLKPGGKENKQVWKGAVGNTITFLYVETVKILYPETGEELTIKEAAEKAQPEYLVITLGVTGGVSQNLSEEEFKRLYRTVVDGILEVSPDTKIILQSILPVTKVNQYEKTITNDKIIPFNGWVADLAKEYYTAEKNVYYADTFSALLDEEGYMRAEYGSGDGLHPCLAGYQAILRYLRTHALTLQ